MKLTATKREMLALCFHVIGSQRQWTAEQSAVRLKAWDELGLRDLALDVSDLITSPGLSLAPMNPWMSRTETVESDISPGTLTFLLNQLKHPADTQHADHLHSLAAQLKELSEAT